MGRLAVAGGHSILGSSLAVNAERVDVEVDGRRVAVLDAGSFVVLPRHGLDTYHAPHAIDHGANLGAVQSLGCDRVLALSSVGGLRRELGVGTVIIPDDFIALHLGGSQYDDDRGHKMAGFDLEWRGRVAEAWRRAQPEARDGGVYWQTIGPRFETAAEIRLMAAHADVVSMTLGAECVVARELGLAYAAVCIVDNLANGVGEQPLTMAEFRAGVEANQRTLLATLDAVLPVLAERVSLTVTNAQLGGTTVNLRAAGDTIAAVGPDVTAQPGDEVLDATGMALLPGLVNGHTHAAMTLFRGFGADLPLQEWLETRIWPIEAKLTADDVYWGTRLACIEMIRSGTVHFWDMYWQPLAVARAVHDAGMRATVSEVLVDRLDEKRGAEVQRAAAAGLEQLAEYAPRVRPALGPHAVYTVSEASLRWCAEQSAARDIPVHIHCSETREEVDDCREANGARPAPYLDRLGLLTPRVLLAHGVWFDDAELRLVAQRGATIVTNPVSNLKLAVGRIFPYPDARDRGIPLGLGTDGAASNNSLDLFQDMKVLALAQKHAADDPAALPAAESWALATGRRSRLLGHSGELVVGAPADFLLVRLDAPELTPGDLIPNLVYAASGAVVDTTIVDGVVLMRNRIVVGADEVRDRVTACARRLGIMG